MEREIKKILWLRLNIGKRNQDDYIWLLYNHIFEVSNIFGTTRSFWWTLTLVLDIILSKMRRKIEKWGLMINIPSLFKWKPATDFFVSSSKVRHFLFQPIKWEKGRERRLSRIFSRSEVVFLFWHENNQ